MEKNKFYLYHRASDLRVLGPGLRDVIWTQGCKHNCKNCIAPDSHPLDKNGYWISVDEIYQEIEKDFIEKKYKRDNNFWRGTIFADGSSKKSYKRDKAKNKS